MLRTSLHEGKPFRFAAFEEIETGTIFSAVVAAWAGVTIAALIACVGTLSILVPNGAAQASL